MLMSRDFFPPGLISFVNIQRQFFDSFVGQTFKVNQLLRYNLLFKILCKSPSYKRILRIQRSLSLSGCGQAGPRLHAGLRLRERDAEQDELCRTADWAFHRRNIKVHFTCIIIFVGQKA